MDLSSLSWLLSSLASFLNVDSTTLLAIVTATVAVCNLIGRLIPDDKTGALGVIRAVCKFIGLYAPNRVATGVTINDVARSVVGKASDTLIDSAEQPGALIHEVFDDMNDAALDAAQRELARVTPVVPAFPGIGKGPNRGPDGKFVPKGDV